MFEAVLVEELARCGSGGVAAGLGAHAQIALPPIANFGTEEQKQRWLVPGIKGEKIAALGITEPEAGSDVAALTAGRPRRRRLHRQRQQDLHHQRLPGRHRGDGGAHRRGSPRGVSLPRDREGHPGFDQSIKLKKLGWRQRHRPDLLSDCRVPAENLVGGEGPASPMIMRTSNGSAWRWHWAPSAEPRGRCSFAIDYAQQRVAFDRPIVRFQTIQHKLVEMATEIEAARQLTYHALWLVSQGIDAVKGGAMAKVAAPLRWRSGWPTRPFRSTAATAT